MELEYHSVAVEGIGYTGYSQLAADLVRLFQSTIDYREKLSGEPKKVEQVIIHALKGLEELPKIVAKHTGFDIHKVKVSKTPDMMFAISPFIANRMATAVATMRAEGEGYYRELQDSKKYGKILSYEEYKSISKAIDQGSGRFDRKKLTPSLISAKIGGTLYFDHLSAFLAKELIHVSLDYMTAEEIAAIVLHELGHVYDTLETAGYQFRRNELLEQARINFMKNAPEMERLKLIREANKEIKDEVVAQNEEALTYVLDHEDLPKDQGIPIFIRACILALGTLILIPLCLPFKALRFILGISGDISDDVDIWPGKLTDIPSHLKFFQNGETSADAFVVQHGLGAGVVSGLEKIMQYSRLESISSPGKTPSTNRSSKAAWWYSYGAFILCHGVFFASDRLRVHPRDIDRLKKVRRSLIKNLTTPGVIPTEMAELILADIDGVDKALVNLSKMTKFVNLHDACREFVVRHLTVGAIIKSITDGKRRIEYTKLIDDIDNMLSNSLYEKSARLAQLAKEK